MLTRERVLIRGGCLLKRGCLSEGGGVGVLIREDAH